MTDKNLPTTITETQPAISDGEEQRRVTFLIGQRVGRKQISNAIQKLLTVRDLIDLQIIKESKQYKGYEHLCDDGKLLTVRSFEEYCKFVEGCSVATVDRDLANLKELGEELFDAMRQIGMGPVTMRNYRKLPEDEKQALFEVAQNGDKDSFVELAETLITKHQREKERLQAQLKQNQGIHEKQHTDLTQLVAQKQSELEAKDRNLKKKSEEISDLKDKLDDKKARQVDEDPQAIERAGYIDDMNAQADAIRTHIDTLLRSHCNAVLDKHTGDHVEHARWLVAAALGRIASIVRILAIDYNISPNELPEKAINEAIHGEGGASWQAVNAEMEARQAKEGE